MRRLTKLGKAVLRALKKDAKERGISWAALPYGVKREELLLLLPLFQQNVPILRQKVILLLTYQKKSLSKTAMDKMSVAALSDFIVEAKRLTQPVRETAHEVSP